MPHSQMLPSQNIKAKRNCSTGTHFPAVLFWSLSFVGSLSLLFCKVLLVQDVHVNPIKFIEITLTFELMRQLERWSIINDGHIYIYIFFLPQKCNYAFSYNLNFLSLNWVRQINIVFLCCKLKSQGIAKLFSDPNELCKTSYWSVDIKTV